jgi:hypothetical protein
MYPLVLHKHLSSEKWNAFPRQNQILMVANEINRAGHWMERFDPYSARKCDERAFELIDLTAEDPKWRGGGLHELLRFRELLAGRYVSGSMEAGYNRALLRVLVQMHPVSAGAVKD